MRRRAESPLRVGGGLRSSPAHWLVLAGAWMLLVLTVQPWSGSGEGATTADSGGSLKGIALLACLGLLGLGATSATRFRVPPLVAVYLAYGATIMVAAVALEYPVDTVLRALRLVLAMLVPVAAWPLIRRRPGRMVDAHLLAYAALAALVATGAVVFPGRAWHQTTGTGGDRLMGAILPMMPPRVGEIGAVLVGLTVLAVLARRVRWHLGLALVALGAALVILSRTRTPALALVLGVLVALAVTRRSTLGRRGMWLVGAGGLAALPFVPTIIAWLTRAQSVEQLTSLSGRTTVWQYIATAETTPSELFWGRGLGQKRVVLRRGEGDINVMAIDNSWLGAYWEAGIVALAFIAVAVLLVARSAMTSPTPYVRAASTFLVVFVLASSFSESGLSDVSSQTLSLVVAATASHADRLRVRASRATPTSPDQISPGSPIVTAATGA